SIGMAEENNTFILNRSTKLIKVHHFANYYCSSWELLLLFGRTAFMANNTTMPNNLVQCGIRVAKQA
ncbi:16851_t:CDS:2, partial [Dentiscutata heterogama]